jgi:UDP-N-acetylmuramoyl-L-alanyl-D-glutamate--2,6-diaminopimelate ligase
MMHRIKKATPQSLKNIYHLFLAIFANIAFRFPSRKVLVIGVTGTDGKTTTCSMIASIIKASGKKVALASTIEFCIGDACEVNKTKFTTLSAWKVQQFLRKAIREKCEVVILEVSSHSLDQNRLWGICPDIAVLTNITREHLDYHKTMKNYRKAKQKLFRCAKKHIINQSLKDVGAFLLGPEKTILYGWRKEKKSVRGVSEHIFGSDYIFDKNISQFVFDNKKFQVYLHGKYNAENAMAALCVAKEMGIQSPVSQKGLKQVKSVLGRFEVIENTREITIIIDYAVTPNALEKLYKTVTFLRKEGKKIIAVFGACGDRDRGKRPIMASIVDKKTDIIILTNEDPYWEDPEQILDELEKGITKKIKNADYFRILDRRKAIKKALRMAHEGDVVVITGKGAEETMFEKGKMTPWNDKKVVQELLKNL